MQIENIKITGMKCGGCTNKVSSALTTVTGVNNVKVSLSNGEAMVNYDEQFTSPKQLKDIVKEIGYDVDDSDAGNKGAGKGCCCG